MDASFHVVPDDDTKVLCGEKDVLSGMSMQLICFFFLPLAADIQCGTFFGVEK